MLRRVRGITITYSQYKLNVEITLHYSLNFQLLSLPFKKLFQNYLYSVLYLIFFYYFLWLFLLSSIISFGSFTLHYNAHSAALWLEIPRVVTDFLIYHTDLTIQ